MAILISELREGHERREPEMTTAQDIKNAYKAAKVAKAASDSAIWNDSLTDAEFDEIIDAECEANDVLIDALVDFSKGIISRDDASNVVLRRFEQVGALVNRLAA